MASATFTPLSQETSSPVDVAARRGAVASVLGTMAAEGDVPSVETLQDFDRYIQGEIDLDEVSGRILRRALS